MVYVTEDDEASFAFGWSTTFSVTRNHKTCHVVLANDIPNIQQCCTYIVHVNNWRYLLFFLQN